MARELFNPIAVSSKFAICGVPLRLDSYAGGCGFGCKYCFANGREVLKSSCFKIGNVTWVKNKLKKVFDKNNINPTDYLEKLLSERYTLHCGGMSDPFQPCENSFHITKQIIELMNEYNLNILFSTKTDRVYDVPINPSLHSFQLSVTNTENNKEFEPFVPDLEDRYKFYCDLKSKGFKVGIRIQPFIPGLTSESVVKKFKDADYFTIEGLKMVPGNKEQKDFILSHTPLKGEDFTQYGLLNLRPELRLKYYEPVLQVLKEYNIPYSISDNDMRKFSSGSCCCGDPLVSKSTTYNTTALIKKYGEGTYTAEDVKKEMGDHGNCKCKSLFASNRCDGFTTCAEFVDKKFNSKVNPMSPKFQYE